MLTCRPIIHDWYLDRLLRLGVLLGTRQYDGLDDLVLELVNISSPVLDSTAYNLVDGKLIPDNELYLWDVLCTAWHLISTGQAD